MAEELLVSVRKAAAMIDCSPCRMYALIDKGIVPSIRLDGGIRVPVESLKRMIEEKLTERSRRSEGGKEAE